MSRNSCVNKQSLVDNDDTIIFFSRSSEDIVYCFSIAEIALLSYNNNGILDTIINPYTNQAFNLEFHSIIDLVSKDPQYIIHYLYHMADYINQVNELFDQQAFISADKEEFEAYVSALISVLLDNNFQEDLAINEIDEYLDSDLIYAKYLFLKLLHYKYINYVDAWISVLNNEESDEESDEESEVDSDEDSSPGPSEIGSIEGSPDYMEI